MNPIKIVLTIVVTILLMVVPTFCILAQPQLVPPPFLPGNPNQVPLGSGLTMALGGGLYAIRKLRQIRKQDGRNRQEIQS